MVQLSYALRQFLKGHKVSNKSIIDNIPLELKLTLMRFLIILIFYLNEENDFFNIVEGERYGGDGDRHHIFPSSIIDEDCDLCDRSFLTIKVNILWKFLNAKLITFRKMHRT